MTSRAVKRTACPACRDSGGDTAGDNLTVYDDGHGFCHACHTYYPGDGQEKKERTINNDFIMTGLEYQTLPHRRISETTCKKFGYRVGDRKEVANYLVNGRLVYQKIRTTDKKGFYSRGDLDKAPLFGQHLWSRGHKIRVTEGEIDAMTLYELSPSIPVVSIPNGAAAGAAAIRRNLEFLEGFDSVEFVFDNDADGKAAAQECASLLSPGKAYITKLRYKDPNEYLKAGKHKELAEDLNNSHAFRPDGIMHASEVKATMSTDNIYPYPFKCMTKKLLGRADGDLTMFCSGTGMGKSTMIREMINFDVEAGEKVGVLMLEESPSDTLNDLIGLRINQPVRRILASQKIQEMYPDDPPMVAEALNVDAYTKARDFYNKSGLYLYNHFGSLESDNLLCKLNYMATGLGCTKIYLDHISIAVSGIESSNERKDIDILMTNLRSFVERTGVWMGAVTHLSRPDGKPFEEGGQITIKHLRGSGGIAQMSDEVVALERNQQAETELERNTTIIRILKARRAGTTGVAGEVTYSHDSGRLTEIQHEPPTVAEVTEILEV